jgi:hypothetical protein
VVAFDAAGRPQLRRLLCRHALVDGWRIEQAAQWCPVTYVLWGRSLLRQPLKQRREALAELCATNPIPGVVFSAGVTGATLSGSSGVGLASLGRRGPKAGAGSG